MIPLRSLLALTLAFLLFFLCATLATAFGIYFAALGTIGPMAVQRICLLGFGSIIAIVLAGTAAFALIVRRRIIGMRRTADAISEGDMTQRMPAGGSGSVFDQQARAFNRMMTRINELMDEVRHVTDGVAHELRTPLARLRNQLSLMEHEDDPALLHRRIGEARAQADSLLSLFAALLRIAEVDSGARRANFQRVALAGLVEECVETLDPVLEESGHRLIRDVTGDALVKGDVQLLSQMIVNLVENAVRHTPGGTRISVSLLCVVGGMAMLTVADNGPGIAPADRERALDRFGRLSGGGGAKGHGFGLPLAVSIARLHGGSLELGDARPGLKVTVLLPLA